MPKMYLTPSAFKSSITARPAVSSLMSGLLCRMLFFAESSRAFKPGGPIGTPGLTPIVLEDVAKRYETTSGPVLAVQQVSLSVQPEEFVSLLGPSGCGKSTVLGMIG